MNDTSPPKQRSACCHESTDNARVSTHRIDYLLWVPLGLVIVLYAVHPFAPQLYWVVDAMSAAVVELINTMALGIVIGVLMVGLLSYVPRELVMGALGPGDGLRGLLRATAAGVLLDLCSHGILMVGAKLYERGVSVGQVMAFLIASPWNSLSLTIVMVALIGVWWTLTFILLSAVVAVLTGALFNTLVNRQVLPKNPNQVTLAADFCFWSHLMITLKQIEFSKPGLKRFMMTALAESRMVIRWLLIGVLLAGLIRTFMADEHFASYFGPTLMGLAITMLAATVVEVCSEGSTPIAADILNRAGAPGNGFAFLMAGVSTDYTEVMVLRERTRSWRIALFLPLLTLPQIFVIAWLLNQV